MKNDKLARLLTQVETSVNTDDELVNLNDELAKNLMGVFGSSNGVCANNGSCSHNRVCINNPICHGNTPIPPPRDI